VLEHATSAAGDGADTGRILETETEIETEIEIEIDIEIKGKVDGSRWP
jgi:hypothetical protein